MKFLNKHETLNLGSSGYLLSQESNSKRVSRKAVQGFVKVLVDGRVVGLDKSKPFQDRMIGSGLPSKQTQDAQVPSVVLLETVMANLNAGMCLLDKQELSLAKIGGKLSEIALSLNQAREYVDQQNEAQSRFNMARENVRKLIKATFDHTVLFATGPSKPIVVAVPTLSTWEGLSIDRCDISSPGFKSIELGKVIPQAPGLLLDPKSVRRSFAEWRSLCAHNRLQWHLLAERFNHISNFLIGRARDGNWDCPVFPDHSLDGPLRRPHRNN